MDRVKRYLNVDEGSNKILSQIEIGIYLRFFHLLHNSMIKKHLFKKLVRKNNMLN